MHRRTTRPLCLASSRNNNRKPVPPNPPHDPVCRQYCVRAVIDNTEATKCKFVGNSQSYDIVEKTKQVCSRYNKECDPSVTITRHTKHCDGTIRADLDDGSTILFNLP